MWFQKSQTRSRCQKKVTRIQAEKGIVCGCIKKQVGRKKEENPYNPRAGAKAAASRKAHTKDQEKMRAKEGLGWGVGGRFLQSCP